MRQTRTLAKDEGVPLESKLPASLPARPATRGVNWFPMDPMSSKKLNPDGFKIARSRWLEDIRKELSYTRKRVISQIFRSVKFESIVSFPSVNRLRKIYREDGLTVDWCGVNASNSLVIFLIFLTGYLTSLLCHHKTSLWKILLIAERLAVLLQERRMKPNVLSSLMIAKVFSVKLHLTWSRLLRIEV